jgi:hypothetical protein
MAGLELPLHGQILYKSFSWMNVICLLQSLFLQVLDINVMLSLCKKPMCSRMVVLAILLVVQIGALICAVLPYIVGAPEHSFGV